MEDGLVHIPYDREFTNELNIERFGLEATGKLKFSHPSGTHDDRLWAFALAVYYARLQPTEYHPVARRQQVPEARKLFPPTSAEPLANIIRLDPLPAMRSLPTLGSLRVRPGG